MTLNVEWLLLPFHAQPFLGFIENGPKKRKYPVSGSCVDKNALLMSEVRGDWADRLEMIEVHVTKLKSSQTVFLEHDNEFTLLKWPPQSPDLNPIEHFWDVVEWVIRIMDVQPTNLQQLLDAIMSIWTKISEECFQHLVESLPRRITAVLKAKEGPTRY